MAAWGHKNPRGIDEDTHIGSYTGCHFFFFSPSKGGLELGSQQAADGWGGVGELEGCEGGEGRDSCCWQQGWMSFKLKALCSLWGSRAFRFMCCRTPLRTPGCSTLSFQAGVVKNSKEISKGKMPGIPL